MKAIAIVLLLAGCASMPRPAPNVEALTVYGSFRTANAEATLFNEPCNAEVVLQFVPPHLRPEMKQAQGTFEGGGFALCWLLDGADVVLVWEDGGITELPKRALTMPNGV